MSATPVPVPDKPLSLDQVIERYPVLRQSLLANYDDCSLYGYFEMRYTQAWGTHPQARGTLFHRFAASALREMQHQDSEQIPKGTALAILEETLEQRDIPPLERVRLPLREVPVLRMAAVKFAKDNTFTIRNIIDIERRLEAVLPYTDDEGQIRERRLSGMPDVIVKDPERPQDGVIVIDWKDTWALPPERKDKPGARFAEKKAAERNLSYHGYFQQRFYAWLILRCYKAINYVTLREFYARRSKTRPATIHRSQLSTVEEELANLVRDFDRSLMAGKPKKLRFPEVASWQPSPGKHCGYCPTPHLCPIDPEVRKNIAIRTEEEARIAVARLAVTEKSREKLREALRPYVEEHGPVAAKSSKGRFLFGLRTNKSGGTELVFFIPEGSDRAPTRKPEDKPLEDALKRAAAAAKSDEGNERMAA